MLNLSVMETKVKCLPVVPVFFLFYKTVLDYSFRHSKEKEMPSDGQNVYNFHSVQGDDDGDGDDEDEEDDTKVNPLLFPSCHSPVPPRYRYLPS